MPTTVDYVRYYRSLGWTIIPLQPRSKLPIDSSWQTVEREDDDLFFLFEQSPDLNIGWRIDALRLDVDLDSPVATRLAPLFLPTTGMVFGRTGKPRSHYIYYLAEDSSPTTLRFRDPRRGPREDGLTRMLGELRTAPGQQTVLPGSIHQSGQRVEWSTPTVGEPATVEWVELLSSMRELMAATLLVEIWPDGSRHDATGALAGALQRAGWSEERVWTFFERWLPEAGESEREINTDRRLVVRDTFARATGRPTTGWPTFERLTDADAAKRIREWLMDAPVHEGHDMTDVGNAYRLIDAFGDDIRYCPEQKAWYYWDLRRWREDSDSTKLEYLFKQVTDIMLDDELPRLQAILRAGATEGADERVRAMYKHIKTSRSSPRIRAAVQVARTLPEVQIQLAELDADPYLLNCQNGTLDLQTGGLRPHVRSDYITKITSCDWSPNAAYHDWDRFLLRSMDNDLEMMAYLQRLAGYSLFHGNPAERFMIVHGPAGSGKSTFVEALSEMLGSYTTTLDPSSLKGEGETGQARSDLVQLRGARMVRTQELDTGQRWSAALVKRLTGGDTITARELYRAPIQFLPGFKMWLSTNERPRVVDSSDGYWRRLIEIPFSHVVTVEEFDERLKDRLKREAKEAILAWAYGGFRMFFDGGLGDPPRRVQEAVLEYRESMDPVAQFIAEQCEIGVDHREPAGPLYTAFRDWCQSSGQRNIMSSASFKQIMETRGFTWVRTRNGNVHEGVRLIRRASQVALVGDPFSRAPRVAPERN